jgi:hypothetical protein
MLFEIFYSFELVSCLFKKRIEIQISTQKNSSVKTRNSLKLFKKKWLLHIIHGDVFRLSVAKAKQTNHKVEISVNPIQNGGLT